MEKRSICEIIDEKISQLIVGASKINEYSK
jgi:hypothetical protein